MVLLFVTPVVETLGGFVWVLIAVDWNMLLVEEDLGVDVRCETVIN